MASPGARENSGIWSAQPWGTRKLEELVAAAILGISVKYIKKILVKLLIQDVHFGKVFAQSCGGVLARVNLSRFTGKKIKRP